MPLSAYAISEAALFNKLGAYRMPADAPFGTWSRWEIISSNGSIHTFNIPDSAFKGSPEAALTQLQKTLPDHSWLVIPVAAGAIALVASLVVRHMRPSAQDLRPKHIGKLIERVSNMPLVRDLIKFAEDKFGVRTAGPFKLAPVVDSDDSGAQAPVAGRRVRKRDDLEDDVPCRAVRRRTRYEDGTGEDAEENVAGGDDDEADQAEEEAAMTVNHEEVESTGDSEEIESIGAKLEVASENAAGDSSEDELEDASEDDAGKLSQDDDDTGTSDDEELAHGGRPLLAELSALVSHFDGLAPFNRLALDDPCALAGVVDTLALGTAYAQLSAPDQATLQPFLRSAARWVVVHTASDLTKAQRSRIPRDTIAVAWYLRGEISLATQYAGVIQDIFVFSRADAFASFARAAEKGFAPANLRKAVLLEQDQPLQALHQLREGAERNDQSCMLALYKVHRYGLLDVEINTTRAIRWIRQCADGATPGMPEGPTEYLRLLADGSIDVKYFRDVLGLNPSIEDFKAEAAVYRQREVEVHSGCYFNPFGFNFQSVHFKLPSAFEMLYDE